MLPSAPSESQYLLKKKKSSPFTGKQAKVDGRTKERERRRTRERKGWCTRRKVGQMNTGNGSSTGCSIQTKTALLMYVEQGKPRREKACRRGREVAKLARNINVEREKDYSKPRSKWIEKCMWIDIETNYKLIRRPETTKISWRKRLKWSEAAGWWSAGDLLSKSLQGKSTVFNKQNYRIPYMQSHFYCNTIADYI